jgi:predicted SAM-dependent methyltransferase
LRNIFREIRQREARKRTHQSIHLDLGAGSFPLSENAVTLDRNPNKKPNIVGNAWTLPFMDESIDCISALEIVEHFHAQDQISFVKEIRRVLKKGATVIFELPNYSSAMKVPQKLVWFIREHTTQKEYFHNRYTHTHIGIISPNELIQLLKGHGFEILERKRLMLYDYLIVARRRI